MKYILDPRMLDYFPMDVRLDQKVEALESLFGNDGLVWILKFWQTAYQTDDGIVNLGEYFGDISAKNSRITIEKQNEIIVFYFIFTFTSRIFAFTFYFLFLIRYSLCVCVNNR